MTAALPLLAAPPAAPVQAPLVSHCANCGALVVAEPGTPGAFAHLGEACKECFGTGAPCPYPELHGAPGRCRGAEAVECAWCHRVLEAALGADLAACPDHSDPCCGCCQPG